MRKIESKNLDVILLVLKELAGGLQMCSYGDYGQLVFTSPIRATEAEEVGCKTTNSLSAWMSDAIPYLIEGKSLKVAEFEATYQNNYHFSSEELWISSTQTQGGNLLIEIWKLGFDPGQDGTDFQEPTLKKILKTYLLEVEGTF